MSHTRDLSDETIVLFLRNKSMSYEDRYALVTNYMRSKYFGDRRELDSDDVHRLVRLVDKFLNRVEKE